MTFGLGVLHFEGRAVEWIGVGGFHLVAKADSINGTPMRDTDYLYYRDRDFRYPLQSHPTYWFCVGKSENAQGIIGRRNQCNVVITFDLQGNLVEVRATESPWALDMDIDKRRDLFEATANRYRIDLGLQDGRINVKRFRLPKLKIGIDDYDDVMQEYLLDPTTFEPVEQCEMDVGLSGWKEEELFVFWWGQDYYVNNEGIVTSS